MKWFRIHHEARTDAKLEALTDAQHRVWFRLMCFASEQPERGDMIGYEDEYLAIMVARGDVELLTETLNRLVMLRIIERREDGVSLTSGLVAFPKEYTRPFAHVWMRIRSVVFERDNYTCRYCGERGKRLECDHVIPVSRGGSHNLDNLVTACFACNRSKRDKLVEECQA